MYPQRKFFINTTKHQASAQEAQLGRESPHMLTNYTVNFHKYSIKLDKQIIFHGKANAEK